MAPTWAELFARVWAIARAQLHDVRKAYRRRRRRWRFRYCQPGAIGAWPLKPKAGAPIPAPAPKLALGHVGINEMLKQCYTVCYPDPIAFRDACRLKEMRLRYPEHNRSVLKASPSPFVPPREPDELDDSAFIFPCHRGLS